MSGKELLIDTNIVIYLLNGDQTIADLLRGKQLYISFITELELLGLKKLSTKQEKLIESFIDECYIINLNQDIKNQYRFIRKKNHTKLADAIIVASAISLNITLLTADKGMKNIKELDLLLYNPA